MRVTRTVSIAVVLVVTAAAITGCARQVAEVTSAWPVASAERRVAQPPVPPRWPYRGTPAPSAAAARKRPLSIKIENSPQARPQIGLGRADVVYETVTEGGITRFNCIFQSDVPAIVGPVRSARLSDLWVVPQYDALFFFSGASSTVNNRVNASGVPNLSQDAGVSYPYFRSTARSAPHNLMLDTKKAYAEAKKRGHAITADLTPLQYERRAGSEATPTVTEITVPFSQANTAKWVYDPDSGRYLRYNNGRVHSDGADGVQLSADNVVVMWARYKAASRDKVGSTTYDINLGGEGRVSVYRGGTVLNGTWSATRDAPPRFTDASGSPIRLAPGRTWFQVIPLDANVLMK